METENVEIPEMSFDEAPPPEKGNGLDLVVAKNSLQKFQGEVSAILGIAHALAVKDEPTLRLAVEIGTRVQKVSKQIDARRKEIIEEPHGFVSAVNSVAKGLQDSLSQIKTALQRKIQEHTTRLELERRKQEDEQRKASAELQAKIDEEAKQNGVEAPQVPVPIVPRVETTVRVDTGTSFSRKEWTFEIVDEKLLPREFLMADMSKLRNAVKMGIREITGVRIYEESKTVFRGA